MANANIRPKTYIHAQPSKLRLELARLLIRHYCSLLRLCIVSIHLATGCHSLRHVKAFFGFRKGIDYALMVFLDLVGYLCPELGSCHDKDQRQSDRQIGNGRGIGKNKRLILEKDVRQCLQVVQQKRKFLLGFFGILFETKQNVSNGRKAGVQIALSPIQGHINFGTLQGVFGVQGIALGIGGGITKVSHHRVGFPNGIAVVHLNGGTAVARIKGHELFRTSLAESIDEFDIVAKTQFADNGNGALRVGGCIKTNAMCV